MGEMIAFSHGSETFEGYLSAPASGTGPGVIVLQEWWGLVGHIKDVANRFAAAGFTALAPDLYRGKSTTEPDEAATLMQALNIAETESILREAIQTLLARPETGGNEKVGVIGFCMGGQLALFAAGSNPQIRATVDFYGIHPAVHPDFAAFNGPLLGIFAEHDTMTDAQAVRALDEKLTTLGKPHTFITYPGTNHAFFNDQRPTVHNPEASQDAWEKTIQFLKAELIEN
jgi:carboxymethylenebutenolidase